MQAAVGEDQTVVRAPGPGIEHNLVVVHVDVGRHRAPELGGADLRERVPALPVQRVLPAGQEVVGHRGR